MACTPTFIEGFDRFVDTADLRSAYIPKNASYEPTLSTETPFGTGKSFYYNEAKLTSVYNHPLGFAQSGLGLSAGVGGSWFCCYRFRVDFYGGTYFSLLGSWYSYGTGQHWSVDVTNSNSIRLRCIDDDEVELVEGFPIGAEEWHSVEVYTTNGGAGVFKIKIFIDGELALYNSTFNGRSSTYDWNYVAPVHISEQFYIDDLVFGTCTDPETDRLGSGNAWIVPVLTVGSDAGTNQFTPSSGTDHYAMVDEVPNDGDTTTLTTSADGQVEEFGLAALSSDIASILAIQPFVRLKGAAATPTREFEVYIDSNETELVVSGPFNLFSAEYLTKSGSLVLLDPDTGAAWTKSAVQSLILGMRT